MLADLELLSPDAIEYQPLFSDHQSLHKILAGDCNASLLLIRQWNHQQGAERIASFDL